MEKASSQQSLEILHSCYNSLLTVWVSCLCLCFSSVEWILQKYSHSWCCYEDCQSCLISHTSSCLASVTTNRLSVSIALPILYISFLVRFFIQLTHKQHRLELKGSSYTWIFSLNIHYRIAWSTVGQTQGCGIRRADYRVWCGVWTLWSGHPNSLMFKATR